MSGQTWRGIGRNRKAQDGNGDLGGGNMFHGSVGYNTGDEYGRRALDADIGILDSENLDLLTANGQPPTTSSCWSMAEAAHCNG